MLAQAEACPGGASKAWVNPSKRQSPGGATQGLRGRKLYRFLSNWPFVSAKAGSDVNNPELQTLLR
jgi:hypothetical protein